MIDRLLSALQKVRPTANGEWVARCPSHNDKSPSLAVKDCGDGRILLHCFAGCSVEEVTGAIGLSLSDLMPPKAINHAVKRVPFNPRTVLEGLAEQALVVSICAREVAMCNPLSLDDQRALYAICKNISEQVGYATR